MLAEGIEADRQKEHHPHCELLPINWYPQQDHGVVYKSDEYQTE